MTTTLNIRPLLDVVKTRLAELLTAQTFHRKEGGSAPVAIHLYRLPNSSREDAAEDVCPWGVVAQLGGNDGTRDGTVRLRAIFGIYNEDETNHGGDADVEELAAAILRLKESNTNQNPFAPHILEPEIAFSFGHPESGAQSHPEYYLTVNLTFTREPVFFNY